MDIYFYESGVKRKGENFTCEVCKKHFVGRFNSKRKFCSAKCSGESRFNSQEINCCNCNKKIFKNKSKLKNSKHGVYFCSRKCKDFSQSLLGNCSIIRPIHYGEGTKRYNQLAKKIFPVKCKDCGIDKSYLLCVHHIDGNRDNNPKDGSNWEVLCLNCHAKRHLKLIGKNLFLDWSELTPRELISGLQFNRENPALAMRRNRIVTDNAPLILDGKSC